MYGESSEHGTTPLPSLAPPGDDDDGLPTLEDVREKLRTLPENWRAHVTLPWPLPPGWRLRATTVTFEELPGGVGRGERKVPSGRARAQQIAKLAREMTNEAERRAAEIRRAAKIPSIFVSPGASSTAPVAVSSSDPVGPRSSRATYRAQVLKRRAVALSAIAALLLGGLIGLAFVAPRVVANGPSKLATAPPTFPVEAAATAVESLADEPPSSDARVANEGPTIEPVIEPLEVASAAASASAVPAHAHSSIPRDPTRGPAASSSAKAADELNAEQMRCKLLGLKKCSP